MRHFVQGLALAGCLCLATGTATALPPAATLDEALFETAEFGTSQSYYISGDKSDRFVPVGERDDCMIVGRLPQESPGRIRNYAVCFDQSEPIDETVPRWVLDDPTRNLVRQLVQNAMMEGEDSAIDARGFRIDARILGKRKRCTVLEVVVSHNGLLADYSRDVACREELATDEERSQP